jgi:AcrR family transcriptional regulator
MDRTAEQLPRGRHGLSRQEVLASQRGRMLAAIGEAVAERGFAGMSVADVISRAGVSRETFSEQFSDKEDCFLAALDAGVDGLVEILIDAMEGPVGTPRARLDEMLAAYFETLAAQPAFARAYLIGAYGAGELAIARRFELQRRFVEVVVAIIGLGEGPDVRFACEALVAMISSLATARVATDRAAELPGLREPIMALADRVFPELIEDDSELIEDER